MQERKGPANEQHVECGVELNPSEVASVILLSRQDLGNEVVLVEEPLATKTIENLKNQGSITTNDQDTLNFAGRVSNRWAGDSGLRGRRSALLGPLRGARRSRKATEGRQHRGMMVVRKQEAAEYGLA